MAVARRKIARTRASTSRGLRGLVSLAGLAQIGRHLGNGYLLKVIADFGKAHMSIVRGTLITLASASIGVLAGGWINTAAATYHWVARSEDNPEEAALAGLLPPLYNNVLLMVAAVIGLVYYLEEVVRIYRRQLQGH